MLSYGAIARFTRCGPRGRGVDRLVRSAFSSRDATKQGKWGSYCGIQCLVGESHPELSIGSESARGVLVGAAAGGWLVAVGCGRRGWGAGASDGAAAVVAAAFSCAFLAAPIRTLSAYVRFAGSFWGEGAAAGSPDACNIMHLGTHLFVLLVSFRVPAGSLNTCPIMQLFSHLLGLHTFFGVLVEVALVLNIAAMQFLQGTLESSWWSCSGMERPYQLDGSSKILRNMWSAAS